MEGSSRYSIGIDLGTTNSVVAYVDTADESAAGIRVFEVAQAVAPGEVRAIPALPSFLYFPTAGEIASGAFDLPWEDKPFAIAGKAARELGAFVPGRQVASAKSWLCQDALDRIADILPREAVPPEPMISPVEASARYLIHLRNAWNHTMAAEGSGSDLLFENQEMVVTVPASFDEEARELTVEGARRAGLQRLTLLEEPLAAFYAWVSANRSEASARLRSGDVVLICDIGGGTSDFSLVRADIAGRDIQFERTAIGEHLLLGGENLDLALARRVEQKLNAKLSLRQRHALKISCSAAKESLLGESNMDRLPINILGSGRAVVGEMLSSELTREEVVEALTAGFLPLSRPDELPLRSRVAGLREVGLPYATDPAITKHLASFLRNAASSMPMVGEVPSKPPMVRPDAVLFNGGFCIPEVTRRRILEAIGNWFSDQEPGWRPEVLRSQGMESAVAVGAAYYGQVRRGQGLRVKAGSARTYYVGTRTEGTAVCVLPAGTDEGTTLHLDREFSVLANRPVSFNLFSSTVRHDPHGAVAELDPEQTHRHGPLTTLLRYGKKLQERELSVRLSVSFTEAGTLELWCESVNSPHRWRLQFEVRRGSADPDTYQPGHVTSKFSATEVSENALEAARSSIRAVFNSSPDDEPGDPASLANDLESHLGIKKESWPVSLVRDLSDTLLEVSEGRRRGAQHEARWLNLLGFCLRPGFGYVDDSRRMSQIRRLYQSGLAFPGNLQNQVNWMVLWRRIAGGLNAGQQNEIRNYLGAIGIGRKKTGVRLNPQLERDGWRLLASLEHLSGSTRVALGAELLRKLKKEPSDTAWLWALGRFGARIPLYGSLACIVPVATAEKWIFVLLELDELSSETASAIVQIGRRTDDRTRDVSEEVCETAISRLRSARSFDQLLVRPLTEFIAPDQSDVVRTFGEALPKGLRLQSTADCLSAIAAIAGEA
jgi:molecular chaperone DnaK (HSP70)